MRIILTLLALLVISTARADTLSQPTATLTRPANTTAYGGTATTPQLVASSTTAGSVVVTPIFLPIGNGGSGSVAIPSLTLYTNATSGWGGVTLLVNLWTAAPTYASGDGGTYAVATGTAFQRAQYSCTLVQNADGATCTTATPAGTSAPTIRPANQVTGAVYFDVEIQSTATPISGQTFTVVLQAWQ